jgi:hypothetical protein
MQTWNAAGYPARVIANMTRTLGAHDVAQQIAPGFLLHFGALVAFPRVGRTNASDLLPHPKAVTATSMIGLRFLPVRKRPNSAHAHAFVTIGRLDGNDIFIADPSVSRFHALIRVLDDGEFVVHDAGSSNGTFVNRVRVATRDNGPPSRIVSGDTIHFGGCAVTFLPAGDALEFLRDHISSDE